MPRAKALFYVWCLGREWNKSGAFQVFLGLTWKKIMVTFYSPFSFLFSSPQVRCYKHLWFQHEELYLNEKWKKYIFKKPLWTLRGSQRWVNICFINDIKDITSVTSIIIKIHYYIQSFPLWLIWQKLSKTWVLTIWKYTKHYL